MQISNMKAIHIVAECGTKSECDSYIPLCRILHFQILVFKIKIPSGTVCP